MRASLGPYLMDASPLRPLIRLLCEGIQTDLPFTTQVGLKYCMLLYVCSMELNNVCTSCADTVCRCTYFMYISTHIQYVRVCIIHIIQDICTYVHVYCGALSSLKVVALQRHSVNLNTTACMYVCITIWLYPVPHNFHLYLSYSVWLKQCSEGAYLCAS